MRLLSVRWSVFVFTLLLVAAVVSGETVSVQRDGRGVHAVDIYLFAGSLRVSASETGEFSVEGSLNGDSGFIDVERARAGFIVRVRRDERPGTPSADLHVEVPAGTRLHVEARDAEVDMSGIEGAVTVKSRRGNIDLEYEGTRAVDLRSVSGDIALEARSFSNVRARSVDGNVRARAERASTVSFRTTGGDIDLHVARFRRGEIELRTTSGTISLTLGENSAAWIEMPPRGAQVDPSPEQAAGAGFAAVQQRRGVAYRVGGGTGDVFISNTGGRNILAVD